MRKLEIWQKAGLIDRATADRITEYEDQHARPLALWAIIGIGALAIGLGLISVVAANWDDIPGMLRLAIHFAVMIGVAAGLLWKRSRSIATDNSFFDDAILFVFAALGLTFFGHLGQYYQTSSPLWQPSLAWLLLFTPMLLLLGRGWLIALLWVGGMIATSVFYVQWAEEMHKNAISVTIGILMGLPAIVIAVSAWIRERSARPNFWLRMEQAGIIALLIGFLGFQLFCEMSGLGVAQEFTLSKTALIKGVMLTGAAAAVFAARRHASGQAVAIILVAVAGADMIAAVNGGRSAFLAGITFMAFWAAAAYAALKTGWRGVFQLAVAIIALRLIVLSFQFADDLLGSGVGLIMTGILTLGIAWGAVRFSKAFAPKRNSAITEGEEA